MQKLRDERLYELTTLVAGQFDLAEVLDKLAEAAVMIIGVKACAIRLLDNQAGELNMRSTFGLSEEYRNKGPVSKNDTVIKAAFAGEPVVLDDVRVDDRVRYREAAIKEGLVSQLTVAMQFRDKPMGVLRLYSPKPKRFSDDDIALARVVASQCAVAITNARLYNQAIEGARMAEQMKLAGVLQRRMIPKRAPLVPGVDVAAIYIPCFDVGGDFYDFLQISDTSFAVVIADVIGKGIPAAIMMSMFRGTVRAYADNYNGPVSIEKIICKLNETACGQCKDGEFISLFYAVFDIKEETITYCNCGHEPTVVIRGRKIIDLDRGGLVLGVDPDADYEIGKTQLLDGDNLLFYTDGLIDASDFQGQLWGREKMLDTAKKFTTGPAKQMVKNILRYRRRFTGLAKQIDDTSVIVVKVDRTAEPKFMKTQKSEP
ncbi:PP2C family protein-serine/threonine phosphatase [Planctomycetota bacterium]